MSQRRRQTILAVPLATVQIRFNEHLLWPGSSIRTSEPLGSGMRRLGTAIVEPTKSYHRPRSRPMWKFRYYLSERIEPSYNLELLKQAWLRYLIRVLRKMLLRLFTVGVKLPAVSSTLVPSPARHRRREESPPFRLQCKTRWLLCARNPVCGAQKPAKERSFLVGEEMPVRGRPFLFGQFNSRRSWGWLVLQCSDKAR